MRIFCYRFLVIVRKYVYLCIVINKQTYNKLNITTMATTFKKELSELMKKSWQLVKTYGISLSEAMKKVWTLFKLRKAMKKGVVKFYFEKLDGTIRTAWGTLREDLIPATSGDNRKKNDSVQVYYDQEKAAFRCFKIVNLIRIA